MPRHVLLSLCVLLSWLAAEPGDPGRPTAILPGSADGRPDQAAWTRVIVQPPPDGTDPEIFVRSRGATNVRRLEHVGAIIADVSGEGLAALRTAATAGVLGPVAVDRPIRAALDRTTGVVGARWVHDHLGFDGAGVSVAIVDSGIAVPHAGLGADRVVHFADFVAFRPEPYDGYGHGTHVAGIIAADGSVRGISPGAELVVLKTLDDEGRGYISDAIAAIDHAIAMRVAYNIRVINLSVAAGVYESYRTDPLALAAARAVDAGIVVVTAAGNLGRTATGERQHGGVTAPGNAPWVLTVGAATRAGAFDDELRGVAPFSSLGPSAIDRVEKPDLIAPGTEILSLADPDGTLYLTRPDARWSGGASGPQDAYLSLSGTSMAAPVVAGGVALMMQANPGLTPATVKAILQVTADPLEGYGPRAQGAGRLNLRAAVALAASVGSDGWPAPVRHEGTHR